MANETEYSNYQTVAAYLDTAIAPHFRAAAIMPNLMHIVNFEGKSDSRKLRKAGSVTATAATESTDHAISEYTETTPNTLTAAEIKVYLELSDKAIKFAQASPESLAQEAGVACAMKFDTDAMALFDSLNGGTQVGVSGADCTPGILLQATFTLNAQNIPGPYVFVLNPVQIFDVQDDILLTGAVAWNNAMAMSFFSGQPPAANGFKGEILGCGVFQSTNTESVNANADWAGACLSPSLALAAGFAGDVTTKIGYNVKKGVTEIGVSLWYDVKEYQDLAGVSIETDQ
jgi:hypothetical protein